MAAVLKLSAETAYDFGFPPPRGGATVRDAQGLIWRWIDEHPEGAGINPSSRPVNLLGENFTLGDLGTWTTTVGQTSGLVGAGLGIAGGLAGAGTAFGAIAGPIGAIVGLIGGLIAGIFGQHAARVAQENKVSGQWAASGPQAISQIMAAWESGSISGSDAKTALTQVQQGFYQNNQSITKYNGQFGSYPDPNAARPSSNCNWACGTSWDLNQEIVGLNSQIDANPSVGAFSASSLTSNPMLLIALAVGAVLLLKK